MSAYQRQATANPVKEIAKKSAKKSIRTKIKRTLAVRAPRVRRNEAGIPSKKTKSAKHIQPIRLERSAFNPIMDPRPYTWESQAVFNPAAVSAGGRVHLFYRALGEDGVSRLGYASSEDGVHFDERLLYPVYFLTDAEEMKHHWPFTSPARPAYDRGIHASGGGWGGCEDPRAVLMEDGYVYLTFNVFNGWDSMRVAVISIKEENLLKKKWQWENFAYLTKLGDRQKNWVLFPEKIGGKFVLFHNLDLGDPGKVGVAYMKELSDTEAPTRAAGALDPQTLPDHVVAWHKRTRSAAAPPIKTRDGWLLLYHAMDRDGSRYKLGAMLLDLKNPEKVLLRAQYPILEPDEWYENDWKPGIIYASGAVVKDGKLFVYYGGGDKHICTASMPLDELLESMKHAGGAKLRKTRSVKIK